MRNIDTKFPDNIDSRIFFCDVNADQVPIMKNYYTFLNAANYTLASEYLNNSEVFFYGAWLLNLLENRLCAIGDYVIKEGKPKLTIYKSSEPSDDETYEGMTWIG